MSEHDEEGQAPEEPTPEGGGAPPPRPTVRESLRRGLFVRLPTESETHVDLPGPTGTEQPAEAYGYPEQASPVQYSEQPADAYAEGWRQTPDGGWEPVAPEASAAPEESEAVPAGTYAEPDQSTNFASVAGGEPFFHPAEEEASAWTFTGGQEASAGAEAVEYQEAAVEETPAPEPEVAQLTAEAVEVAPVEVAPAVEAEVAAEPQPASPMLEDPIAASGVYIPPDVELLEGDMPLYGEKDKVAPIFKGEGLGEPHFIEFGDLPKTLVGLRRLLPAKTRLTYNFDYERAWVRASSEVDLPSFVERAQALDSEAQEASE